MNRGVLFSRLAVTVATILWVVAWGRLGAVALTQPSRWQNSTVTLADGQAVADRRTFGCRLNAFQRDNLIYRSCDRDGRGAYVVAFDPAQRTIVARWELPKSFIAPDWFTAVATDPTGALAVLEDESGTVARLHNDNTVEELPPAPLDGIPYGFGWQGDRLGLVAARFDATGSVTTLTTHEPGAGWSTATALPAPACGDGLTCTPLVATPTPQGWATYYARAPRQPSDPAQIAADILLVTAAGTTQVTQTVTLTAASKAYRIEDGQLRWSSRLADRSAGNVLNYGGFVVLQQLADGKFSALPTPPDNLFGPPDESPFAPKPGLSALTASYELAPGRLIWRPTYNRGGFAGATERALLLDDRWLVLRKDTRGISLEERPRDPTASYPPDTFTARGPLILGQQADLLSLSDFSAPLLPAAGGGYWLLGRHDESLRVGPDLRRLDDRNPVARLGLLFSDFGGGLDDKFHRDTIWPKRAALAWVLVAWPLLAVVALLRGRRAHDEESATPARLRRAATLYLVFALLSAYWFWTATAFF